MWDKIAKLFRSSKGEEKEQQKAPKIPPKSVFEGISGTFVEVGEIESAKSQFTEEESKNITLRIKSVTVTGEIDPVLGYGWRTHKKYDNLFLEFLDGKVGELKIGRGEFNEIEIPDQTVSSEHAKFIFKNEDLYFVDKSGSGGILNLECEALKYFDEGFSKGKTIEFKPQPHIRDERYAKIFGRDLFDKISGWKFNEESLVIKGWYNLGRAKIKVSPKKFDYSVHGIKGDENLKKIYAGGYKGYKGSKAIYWFIFEKGFKGKTGREGILEYLAAYYSQEIPSLYLTFTLPIKRLMQIYEGRFRK